MKHILLVIFALFGLITFVGCMATAKSSQGMLNSGIYSRAHHWETPHLTHTPGNPASLEIGMGYATIGGDVGWNEEAQHKWATFASDIGPDPATTQADATVVKSTTSTTTVPVTTTTVAPATNK